MGFRKGTRILTILKAYWWYDIGQKYTASSYDICADEYTVWVNREPRIVRGRDVSYVDKP